jgi:hypothetical protein
MFGFFDLDIDYYLFIGAWELVLYLNINPLCPHLSVALERVGGIQGD